MGALWQVGLRLYLGHQGNPCPAVTNRDGQDEGISGRSNYFVVSTRRKKCLSDTGQGYDRGPPGAFAADSGLEGDIWGDPEVPDTVEFDDDNDDPDLMEPQSTGHPSTLPRPPHFDDDRNPFVTIVDVTGIHHLSVVECSCRIADLQTDIAYLKMGLVVTSFQRIQTVFTIDVLKDFRVSNLECKTSAYQYYQKLRRLTCPAFPKAVLNRYRELRRLSREYRNMKLWKMHGRAHDEPDGPINQLAAGTRIDPDGPENQTVNEIDQSPTIYHIARGKLAFFCPACPQPGVNLPDGWMDDPQRYRTHNLWHAYESYIIIF